jgi:hypothetical protein
MMQILLTLCLGCITVWFVGFTAWVSVINGKALYRKLTDTRTKKMKELIAEASSLDSQLYAVKNWLYDKNMSDAQYRQFLKDSIK